jgi:DNA repair protein RadD
MTKEGSRIRKLLKELKVTNVLGLTATPVYLKSGMEGSRLVMINRSQHTIFPDIAHVTQIKELVDSGYWSKLNYRVVQTDESSLQYNSTGSDYTIVSQRRYFNSNNLHRRIREEIYNLKAAGRKSILVFVPTIHEANDLMRITPNSAVVHSKIDTKTRDFVVEAFKNLEIPVVFNVNVLATGFDHPELDAVITARPTTSVAIYYQQIGRLVRIHENKKDGFITDFSGNVGKFGRVEELTFEKIPQYGWGMFGTGDRLLSDIPVKILDRPTKKDLIEGKKAERERAVREITSLYDNPDGSVKMWFGKWKDRTVRWLYENERDYLSWMYENLDFSTEKSRALRADIERHFGIENYNGEIAPEDRF